MDLFLLVYIAKENKMSLKDNYTKFREQLRNRGEHIHTIFSSNDVSDILDYHLTAGRSNAKIRISQWSEFDWVNGTRVENFKESAHLQLDYYEEYGDHEEHMSIQIPTEMIDSDYTDEMILYWWKDYSFKQFENKSRTEINQLYFHIRNNPDVAKDIVKNADLTKFNYETPFEHTASVIDKFNDMWSNRS